MTLAARKSGSGRTASRLKCAANHSSRFQRQAERGGGSGGKAGNPEGHSLASTTRWAKGQQGLQETVGGGHVTAPALTQSVDVPWQANALIPEIQFRGDALAFSTEADGLCSSQLPQPQREG